MTKLLLALSLLSLAACSSSTGVDLRVELTGAALAHQSDIASITVQVSGDGAVPDIKEPANTLSTAGVFTYHYKARAHGGTLTFQVSFFDGNGQLVASGMVSATLVAGHSVAAMLVVSNGLTTGSNDGGTDGAVDGGTDGMTSACSFTFSGALSGTASTDCTLQAPVDSQGDAIGLTVGATTSLGSGTSFGIGFVFPNPFPTDRTFSFTGASLTGTFTSGRFVLTTGTGMLGEYVAATDTPVAGSGTLSITSVEGPPDLGSSFKNYTLHGSITATLDAYPGGTATGTVMISGTF